MNKIVVLDTNILLVSLPRKSKYRIIFDSLINNKFTLAVSNEILNEYREIISKKMSPEISDNLLALLVNLSDTRMINIHYKWNLIEADKDDNKFSDCYLAANADYLVTNDKHFDNLKNKSFPLINILDADEFCQICAF